MLGLFALFTITLPSSIPPKSPFTILIVAESYANQLVSVVVCTGVGVASSAEITGSRCR